MGGARAFHRGLLYFRACLQGDVFRAKLDSNLFQEIVGRGASREDPHKVIGNLFVLAVHLKNHALRLELDGRRVEQDP